MSKETKAEKDTAKKTGKKAENNTPPKEENKPQTCGECKKGKHEEHNGKDVVRCQLRTFLQRANQKACEACE